MLVLDEPTAAMGVSEAAQLERLLERMRQSGMAMLLATRDVGQMFRIAERIVVLRHGRIVAEIEPQDSHPDDVAAVLAGGTVDGSARRQLTRLHGLADSLAVADPSSGLSADHLGPGCGAEPRPGPHRRGPRQCGSWHPLTG